MKLQLATLAALAFAASVGIARAEGLQAATDADAAPVRTYLESLDHAAPKAISEGRQVAPSASSASVSAAQRFVIDRSQGER